MSFPDYPTAVRCPYCDAKHDASMKVAGSSGPPGDGSISICAKCGHVGVFEQAAPGGIRRSTAKEAAEFAADAGIARVLLAWRIGDQKRRAKGLPHA